MIQDDEGYAILPAVLEHGQIAEILDALAGAHLSRSRAGARHLFAVRAVADLANDPRVMRIAARFVGPRAVPFRATLFEKSPGANWLVAWHQDAALPLRTRLDGPEWGPWSIKAGIRYARAPAWALETVIALRVSLDDSTESNGPLRVLPGTHRYGVLSDIDIARLAAGTVPVECTTPAGGVIAMRPLTVHASSKSTSDQPRRVLHIEYAASLVLSEGVELAVG